MFLYSYADGYDILCSGTIVEINYRIKSYLIDDAYDDYNNEDDGHKNGHNNEEDDEKRHYLI